MINENNKSMVLTTCLCYVMKGSDTKNVSYVFSAYVAALEEDQTVK